MKFYIAFKKLLEQALRDFVQFLCFPRIAFRHGVPGKLINIFVLFLIIFILEIIVAGVLFSLIGLELESHKMTDLLENMDYLQVFALAVIIAPVMEEFIFRYYITKPRFFIFLLIPVLAGLLIHGMYANGLSLVFGIPALVLLLVAFLVIIVNKAVQDLLSVAFIEHFPYIFYTSAVLFAFVHVFNFDSSVEWYYTPVLVFPQFVIGVYLGYIRVRFGMIYCILVHMVNNLIPMLILLIGPAELSG